MFILYHSSQLIIKWKIYKRKKIIVFKIYIVKNDKKGYELIFLLIDIIISIMLYNITYIFSVAYYLSTHYTNVNF